MTLCEWLIACYEEREHPTYRDERFNKAAEELRHAYGEIDALHNAIESHRRMARSRAAVDAVRERPMSRRQELYIAVDAAVHALSEIAKMPGVPPGVAEFARVECAMVAKGLESPESERPMNFKDAVSRHLFQGSVLYLQPEGLFDQTGTMVMSRDAILAELSKHRSEIEPPSSVSCEGSEKTEGQLLAEAYGHWPPKQNAAPQAAGATTVRREATPAVATPSETKPILDPSVYDETDQYRTLDKSVRSWEWPVNTVGRLIASLQTLPPQMPFYTAYFVEIDGVKVARVRNPSLSRETTDGFRVEKYSPDNESLVMWASQDQRTANSAIETGKLARFAAKCRPAVAHYMRTQERAAMSSALSPVAVEAAEKEAAWLGRLLDEIDAMCPSPEQSNGRSDRGGQK